MSQEEPTNKPEDKKMEEAVESAKKELKEALQDINGPEKAEAVVEELITEQAEQPALEVAAEEAEAPLGATAPEQAKRAAEAIEEAAEAEQSDIERAAEVLKTTAAEVTALEGSAHEALAEEVQTITSPAQPEEDQELESRRRYLREAFKKHARISQWQVYDTDLFIFINHYTPRTPLIDAFFYHLSFWFRGGVAWLIGVAILWPFNPGWAKKTLGQITWPIWIAGSLVEGPIKFYFRRERPFIDIVRAIVVGKKPGNWSFPSGHSAVAFAGARMLSRVSPRWRALWYGIAGLVGFSRIYLGAHYPGDVVTGSLCGVGLSELARWAINRWKDR